jgi:hypothetical protein
MSTKILKFPNGLAVFTNFNWLNSICLKTSGEPIEATFRKKDKKPNIN